MKLTRNIAITGASLILLSLLLVCLLAGAYLYLPFYLETRVIPQLAANANLANYAVRVRNIGFFSADLANLRIGPRANSALFIRSVQVDYSPRSLYRQKITKITLSGIKLHGTIVNGQFKLRGVDFKKIMTDSQKREKSIQAPSDTSPPFILERLEIRDSQIIIGYDDRFYRVPVEIDLIPQDPNYNVFGVKALLYPRGEKITASLKIDRAQHRVSINMDSAIRDLERFADLTGRMGDYTLAGNVTLQGKAEVLWKPLRIANANVSLTLQHGHIRTGDIRWRTATVAEGKENPFQFDLTAKSDTEWHFSGSSLSMVAPAPLTLVGFGGTIKRNAATLESSGNFSAVLHSTTAGMDQLLPVKIQDRLPLLGRFSAVYHRSGKWECEVSNDKPALANAKAVRLSFNPFTITSAPPEFDLSAKAESKVIDATYRIAAPTVQITTRSESINIPELLLKGTAQISHATNGAAQVNFDIQAPKTGIKVKDGTIKITRAALSGKLNRDAVRQITLGGELKFAGAGGRFSRFNTQITGARGKIPFRWPVDGKTAKGNISVTNLKYQGLKLGRIDSQVRQTSAGFAFSGRHQSALLPRMNLNFKGESRIFNEAPAEARVHFELSRPTHAPEVDLGKIYPAAKGVRIKGKFKAKGDLALNSNGFSGGVRADFNRGHLSLGKNELTLDGIRMSLNLPELPKIRSAPGQQIHFNKLSLGDFIVQKGRIDFQIESARSVLIEKMHFLWCDGNVETQSIRLSPGADSYHMTFYCDRLNLAKVLEQFGAAAAEGQGSVNGRIPLQYADGKIKFNDGFLFSTPGKGGKIYLSGTDILTAGIPPNTPQYVQMELAREALKDYDYSWAKLNITSRGEELFLQMQMDGKPAKTLPFVYRKDIGGFMKVEANAKGSKFQGIRLDVNFRLPLNKLLQYKDLINMMQ